MNCPRGTGPEGFNEILPFLPESQLTIWKAYQSDYERGGKFTAGCVGADLYGDDLLA